MPNKLAEELVPGRPDDEDMGFEDEGKSEVVALLVRRGRAGVTGMQEVGSPTR